MIATMTDNRKQQYGSQTGSSYISGTNTDSVEITLANPGFSTVTSLKKVLPNDCDDDRK